MIFPALLLLLPTIPSSPLTGDWITSDQSVVRVYTCENTQLCVRVVTIGRKDAPRLDVNNPDGGQRARPLCGLTIGTGFAPDGTDAAKDGKIYDPLSGKTYSAKMERSGDALKLRGFIGISLLGRTEVWHRTAATAEVCQ